MLTELHIERLGIIEDVTLAFGPGLIALTGETGAGKTMLISALQLLAGGRADASMVRHGAQDARIDGRFEDGDDEWVLSRVIPSDGRSRGYINGRPASATELAELAGRLVDLHGQHAQQSLLVPAAQRALVDAYAGSAPLLAAYREARATWLARCSERDADGGDPHARAREVELLRYQVHEIDAAELRDGEDVALEREEDLLANAVSHQEVLARAYDALQEQASDGLGIAAGALGGPFDALGGRARALQAEAADLAAEVRALQEEIVVDPERLEFVRVRRQLLRELQRKYGESVAAVIAFGDSARARLNALEQYEHRAAARDAEIAAAHAVCVERAATLTNARIAAATKFGQDVTAILPDLAMAHAAFLVECTPSELGEDGADELVFVLAANPGEPARSLAKTASGGELSRTMLAIRVVLADHAAAVGGPATLVFDEVDAGIGGETGGAIGRALASLADDRQVLCVTHLPQVAACAVQQVAVRKRDANGRTIGEATPVQDAARITEIARMLGDADSEVVQRHATDLVRAGATRAPS
ncbi:MAG: DNA repair protein RecN [Acidimicrobiia bacterium]